MKKIVQDPSKVELCYVDVGGTFTDSFVVLEDGDYLTGKAPTTPHDLRESFFNAVAAAGEQRALELKDIFSQASVVGFGSTVAINTIINRNGAKVGVIVTKGFEHLMIIGRGVQSWAGYDMSDMLHARTHRRDKPLVPYSFTKGVTERINCKGEVVIPLYEDEVRSQVRRLIEEGVDSIAVCLLFSWQNKCHENKVKEIIYEVGKEMGKDISVYLSSEINPVIKELPRLNSTVAEAYTAAKMADEMHKLNKQLKVYGYKGSLQVMQAAGGLVAATTIKSAETIESGPVGGLLGALYLSKIYGFDNIITTDVGGTSFDVGLITNGMLSIDREPIVNRMLLGIPVVRVDSIGAGGGTHVSVDYITGRLKVGPTSAGGVPGPVCYDMGGEIPTTTDCDLALGYIDPDYFLGGRIKLNKEKAMQGIKAHLADRLGISIAEAALGARELLAVQMGDAIKGMVMSKGYSISEYYLLAFGGGGATHCAGYTKDLPLKGILIVPFAPVFSAFGAASADYTHNYFKSLNIVIPPFAKPETIIELVSQVLTEGWESLEDLAYREMEQEGLRREHIKFTHLAMVRYGRQLNDVIVTSPIRRISNIQDWKKLIAAFEEMYTNIYATAAKFPQAGYEILGVGLVATVSKIKPRLRKNPFDKEKPDDKALKGKRDCYFNHRWCPTNIYDWGKLRVGNVVFGPSILESPHTNFVIPEAYIVSIDEYGTAWLRLKG